MSKFSESLLSCGFSNIGVTMVSHQRGAYNIDVKASFIADIVDSSDVNINSIAININFANSNIPITTFSNYLTRISNGYRINYPLNLVDNTYNNVQVFAKTLDGVKNLYGWTSFITGGTQSTSLPYVNIIEPIANGRVGVGQYGSMVKISFVVSDYQSTGVYSDVDFTNSFKVTVNNTTDAVNAKDVTDSVVIKSRYGKGWLIEYSQMFLPTNQDNVVSVNVKDYAGNNMSTYSWSFKAGLYTITKPYVLNLSPVSDASQVNINTNVEFDVVDDAGGLVQSSINVSVDGSDVTGSCAFVAIHNGYHVTYQPAQSFAYGHVATVIIQAENLLHYKLYEEYTFTTSVDVQGPCIVSKLPREGASEVALDTSISFNINDRINGVDLNSVVVYVNGVNQTSNFIFAPEACGYYAFYQPAIAFYYNHIVTVRVLANDSGGNHTDITYAFNTKTLTVAPYLVNVVPAAGGLNVPNNTEISFAVQDDNCAVIGESIVLKFNNVDVTSHATILPVSKGYRVVYTPSSFLGYNVVYPVDIFAKSTSDLTVHDSYTFTTFLPEGRPDIGLNVPFILYGYSNFPTKAYSFELYRNADDYVVVLAEKIQTLYDRLGYVFNVGDLKEAWYSGETLDVKEFDINGEEISNQKVVIGGVSPQRVLFENFDFTLKNLAPISDPSLNLEIVTGADLPYKMIVSEHIGFADVDWKDYQKDFIFDSAVTLGVHTIYAKVKDINGNESRIAKINFSLENALPTNPSTMVQEGSIVNFTNIHLVLKVDNPYQFMVDEDNSFINSKWQDFKSVISFNLSPNNGAKVIYTKFKTKMNNESPVIFTRAFLVGGAGTPSTPLLVEPALSESHATVSNTPFLSFKNELEDGVLKYKIELSTDNFAETYDPYYTVSTFAVFDQADEEYYYTKEYSLEPWRPQVHDWMWNDVRGKLVYVPSGTKPLKKANVFYEYSDFLNLNTSLGHAIMSDSTSVARTFYVDIDLDTISDTQPDNDIMVFEAWLGSIIVPRITDEIINWATISDMFNAQVNFESGKITGNKLNVGFVIKIDNLSKYLNSSDFNKTVSKLSKLVAVFEKNKLNVSIFSEKNFVDSCVNFGNNILSDMYGRGHNIGTYINIPTSFVDNRDRINYAISRKSAIDALGVINSCVMDGKLLDGWESLLPSMGFSCTIGYGLPKNYRFAPGEWWAKINGYSGGSVAEFKVPRFFELMPGTYYWRVSAFNGFSWSEVSTVGVFNIGRYQDRTDEWNFTVKSEYVKVYWSDGIVFDGSEILFIKNAGDINPAQIDGLGRHVYSLEKYPCSKNWEWWMIVRKIEGTNMLTLDNGGIKFCDKEALPLIITANDGWIPVLYFVGGVLPRTPALYSSYVSVTANNLSITDRNRPMDKTIRDHANDYVLHTGSGVLELPDAVSKVVLSSDKFTALASFTALANQGQRNVGMHAQGWGIGLIGIDAESNLFDLDMLVFAGTGAYGKGNNYDLMLKNGTIVSQSGSVKIGKNSKPNKLRIVSDTRPGLVA